MPSWSPFPEEGEIRADRALHPRQERSCPHRPGDLGGLGLAWVATDTTASAKIETVSDIMRMKRECFPRIGTPPFWLICFLGDHFLPGNCIYHVRFHRA